ncbi:MAG: VWA domain-containing protein, partial [Phycisphaerae bacterium]|nr:VWA domain-containing protein [Phycisphaerae bacterium]
EYVYSLNTEKFSSAPLDDVSITVNLKCNQPIKTLYCPSHEVAIHRDGENAATVSYGARSIRPDTDFKLVFSESTGDIGINLLTCKSQADDEGYFLLLAAPGVSGAKVAVQPKDVCFVLDTSGSMAGPKMEQAKRALKFCLNNLNDGDGFEVIRFSSEAEPLFASLKPATKENVDLALKFVDGLHASGGTAIDDALSHALSIASHTAGRPYLIVFLTDGRPTVGQTDEDKLVADAINGASGGATVHIFCFGIGNDVNTHLLDRIADGTRAASAYVGDNEDIEVKVSNLYGKIREPALTDVAVSFDGSSIHPTGMYPSRMPDLFKGEMLIAFGKYTGSGDGDVKITGNFGGERKEFTQAVKFTADDGSRQYIPRLWATRRIGWLLDEIRLHGESAELKEETTKLARQWGIVTPYTSYLIMEDETKRSVPLSMQSMRQMNADTAAKAMAGSVSNSIVAEAANGSLRSGAQASANAEALNDLKFGVQEGQAMQSNGLVVTAAPAEVSATTQPAGYKAITNYAQQVKVVNGRSFYQNGNTWLDSNFQFALNMKHKRVKFASDEYFTLLNDHHDAAAWFALGNNVDVVIGDTMYSIRDE